MSAPGRQEDGGLPPPAGRGPVQILRRPLVLLALALLVTGAVGIAWWAGRQADGMARLAGSDDQAPVAIADLPRGGDRAVVVLFPRWDGDGWVGEDRRIPSGGQPGEDLLAVMAELCAGPATGRAINPLPRGTRALAAFLDVTRGAAVVDFSRELVTGHPGGSEAEAATLAAIMRTLAVNFPQVETCTILVDGRAAGSLAGHVDLTRPLVPRRWL